MIVVCVYRWHLSIRMSFRRFNVAMQAFAPVKPNFGGWGRQHVWQTWRRCADLA